MRTFADDYQKGLENEDRVKSILNAYFDDTFEKLPPKHPMDFLGSGGYLEIKGRTCSATKYETTMIPYSKVIYARTATAPATFVFTFNDGSIYYIHYNEEQFKSYEVLDFQRRPRPDHYDRSQLYCYIPISDLTKIEVPY
jgi:hypothetical protein